MANTLKRLGLAVAAIASIAGLAGPARADVMYSYDFGTAAAGTFTTGAAATDLGYFLVTALTVTSFTDSTLGPVAVSISANTPGQFAPGAAYDPTTGTFLNHFGGGFANLGDIGNPGQGETAVGTINGQSAFILGPSFASGSNTLSITGGSGANATTYTASGTLVITPLSAVPEPSTYALLGVFGVAGSAAAWLRRKRAA